MWVWAFSVDCQRPRDDQETGGSYDLHALRSLGCLEDDWDGAGIGVDAWPVISSFVMASSPSGSVEDIVAA